MNVDLSPRTLFTAAFVLIIGINVLVLGGAYYNRSGEPRALAVLSERELHLSSDGSGENSGIRLRLTWRTFSENTRGYYSYNDAPIWFDAAKLESIGFDVERYRRVLRKEEQYTRPLPRKVYLVLEMNSPFHDRTVRAAEAEVEKARKNYLLNSEDDNLKHVLQNAEENLAAERTGGSRLFVIDAGNDRDALRLQYPDRNRYIVAPGIVRIGNSVEGKNEVIRGFIEEPAVEYIHVPLALRSALMRLTGGGSFYDDRQQEPRYQARLAYGKKDEPWLVSVEPMKK